MVYKNSLSSQLLINQKMKNLHCLVAQQNAMDMHWWVPSPLLWRLACMLNGPLSKVLLDPDLPHLKFAANNAQIIHPSWPPPLAI